LLHSASVDPDQLGFTEGDDRAKPWTPSNCSLSVTPFRPARDHAVTVLLGEHSDD